MPFVRTNDVSSSSQMDLIRNKEDASHAAEATTSLVWLRAAFSTTLFPHISAQHQCTESQGIGIIYGHEMSLLNGQNGLTERVHDNLQMLSSPQLVFALLTLPLPSLVPSRRCELCSPFLLALGLGK